MSQTAIGLRWLDEQIQALTRPDDRALFGLDSERSADSPKGDKSEPAATPITARQKKLLGNLVEEHSRLAREFGVDPDEPGLEEIGKATSLIGAMLDRVNAQALPDETMTIRAAGRRAATDRRPVAALRKDRRCRAGGGK